MSDLLKDIPSDFQHEFLKVIVLSENPNSELK